MKILSYVLLVVIVTAGVYLLGDQIDKHNVAESKMAMYNKRVQDSTLIRLYEEDYPSLEVIEDLEKILKQDSISKIHAK